jgi:hypothetical protein
VDEVEAGHLGAAQPEPDEQPQDGSVAHRPWLASLAAEIMAATAAQPDPRGSRTRWTGNPGTSIAHAIRPISRAFTYDACGNLTAAATPVGHPDRVRHDLGDRLSRSQPIGL